MDKNISFVLAIVGAVLIIFGITAADSFSSDVSRLFTGAPTDKAMWMLIVGVIAAIAGFSGLTFGARTPKE